MDSLFFVDLDIIGDIDMNWYKFSIFECIKYIIYFNKN